MFAKYNQILPNFSLLNREQKVLTMLCPATNVAAKLINKYIYIMFKGRDKIEEGLHPTLLTFPPQVLDYCPPLSETSFSSNISESSVVGHLSSSDSEYFSESE
jgi:hypothetical protein